MASRIRRTLLLALLVSPARPAHAIAAEERTTDPGRFPRLVRLLLLPEERTLLEGLKEDKDRREFQKIFWARRDPTRGTAENEVEANARAVWTRADDLFSYANQKGAETGCGQVLLLLGRPEEVRGPDAVRAPDVGARFDDLDYLRQGGRQAETWVYRDRAGRPFHFTRAELLIGFDPECRFGEGGIVADDLGRAAAALVTRAEIGYRRDAEGRLVTLEQARAAAPGAVDLLTEPRSDFPLSAETKLVTRAPKGVFVAGLARIPSQGGTAPEHVVLAFRAGEAGGAATVTGSRDSRLAPAEDGASVASWDLLLAPGRHRVTLAALLPESGKGSTTSIEVEVPDLAKPAALVVSPLVLYPDEPPAAAAADPSDAYASFQVGARRLRPRYGNAFAPQDALVVVALLFGARVDATTGRAALRSRFTILKDGQTIARGGEDAFATPDAVASVGPIPLSGYAPGAYLVRLEVTDAVANTTLRQEAPLQIRAAQAKP